MIKTWEILQEEMVFANQYVKVKKRTFKMPNGKIADYFIRDGMGDVASILALTSDLEFILAREFRPGPVKIIDELPGGIVDKGESPLAAAKRELMEETGYSGEFIFLAETYLSAYAEGKKFCYLALNCQKVMKKKANEQEHEYIEVISKEKNEFFKQVTQGELTDLETALLGMKYLQEHHLI